MRPDQHGVMDLVTHLRDKVPSVVTLPQRFREAGYAHGSACVRFTFIYKNKMGERDLKCTVLLYCSDLCIDHTPAPVAGNG